MTRTTVYLFLLCCLVLTACGTPTATAPAPVSTNAPVVIEEISTATAETKAIEEATAAPKAKVYANDPQSPAQLVRLMGELLTCVGDCGAMGAMYHQNNGAYIVFQGEGYELFEKDLGWYVSTKDNGVVFAENDEVFLSDTPVVTANMTAKSATVFENTALALTMYIRNGQIVLENKRVSKLNPVCKVIWSKQHQDSKQISFTSYYCNGSETVQIDEASGYSETMYFRTLDRNGQLTDVTLPPVNWDGITASWAKP